VREAARGAVLVFDFDGTLARMVGDRGSAAMTEHTRALLRAVAVMYPCAVVSGRARADVAARLANVPLRAIVGNHGAEPDPSMPPLLVRARARSWAAALRASVDEEGIDVEDKGISVAVHVRHARSPAEAHDRISRLASALPGARVFGGKAVVNVVPEGAGTKAGAVETLAARFAGSLVMYVGDDETDEDAFRSRAVTWGVRVGRSERSAAGYYLEDQFEVDTLLRAVLFEHARQGRPFL